MSLFDFAQVGDEMEYAEGHVLCPKCRCCDLFSESCWNCGGEGLIDRYDDDPLWYVGKWRYQKCEFCKGEGGWWTCSCDEQGEHKPFAIGHHEARP